MLSLRDLQQRFYEAALHDDATALAGVVREGTIPSAHRIDVYRNNASEGFRKALAADYPVVERLVGEACFRGLARGYARSHPSRNGDLQDFGRAFASFLDDCYRGSEYAWLGDVARLEWACVEALLAAPAVPIVVQCLDGHRADEMESLCLRLHPASRLVRSPYPILRIWQMNQPGADPDATVDLAAGGDAVLVLRRGTGIELRRLESGEWRFLAALRSGRTLGAALDAAVAEDRDFDLSRALMRAFALDLVVGRMRSGVPALPNQTAESR